MTRFAGEHQNRRRARRILFFGGGFLLGFLLLAVLAIQAWEFSNSPTFCTNACHDVHPEEPLVYRESYHAEVKCTECHMGRVPVLEAIALKASHARHLPAVLLNRYERPLHSETMRPANESCEKCHWPAAFHGDTAQEIASFLPDRENTEQRTYLLLRTGAPDDGSQVGRGIHWHISNPVEYIGTGQDIRWVRATRAGGQTTEYNDALNPLSPDAVEKAEKRTMDCIDCHNRVGHPFSAPEAMVDQALADGRLSSDLPFVKARLVALLTAEFASQDEALDAVESLKQELNAYPGLAASRGAEIKSAVALAAELVRRTFFEEPGVTWASFADNSGHRDSAGCFRCHDGKHVSQEGDIIRLECNLCHSIPLTVAAGDDPPQVPIAALREPASHVGSNFVADHRFLANDTCGDCHGPIAFGEDDSTFCANSSCHGRTWPAVDLDATLDHPIPLEGKHASTWCYTCHQGSKQVAYECSGCHEPSTRPHYGESCQDCHTTGGFALASLNGFAHPLPLEGRHATLDCAACHSDEAALDSDCTACHQPPEDHLAGACHDCHTSLGWTEGEVLAVGRGPVLKHATYDDCLVCHDPRGQNWPAPASHRSYQDEGCLLCHSGLGTRQAIPDHQDLEIWVGQHAEATCVACHENSSLDQSSPKCYNCHADDDRHAGQFSTDCAGCHDPDGWPGATLDHSETGFLLTGRHTQATCAACHTVGVYDGTPQICAACHAADDRHAGQFGQDCAACHSPSGWPGAPFDHGKTGFALTGRHTQAGCDQCHTATAYAGTPQGCAACHAADDRHNGQFGPACATCHTTSGWPGASLDHNQAGFALTGQHAGAACSACHASGVYDGTPQACAACHGADDRHKGQFGQDCAACHTTSGWAGASFDHNQAGFALTGQHAGAACAACHANGVYDGTPQACAACHAADDRHNGQFGQDCAACHTTNGWPGASFDHNQAGFALTGQHAGAACSACHANGVYDGTPQGCAACHAGDDRHNGQFGPDCAACHTTNGWPGASLDHNQAGFALTGQHAGAACSACHANGVYDGTPQECAACHGGDDRHNGQFGPDCAACHTTNGWPGASFDHNQAGFALTGQHAGAACAACHANGVYDGTPQACSACHGEPPYHAGVLGSECGTCHTPAGWLPAQFGRPHAFPFSHGDGGSCRTCHPDTLSGYTCFQCHDPGEIAEEHEEETGGNYQNCATCHPTGDED